MHALVAEDTWQSRFKDNESNHEGRRAWLRRTGRPDIQLPWHLEEKAVWCGRQNGAVFVFFCLSVAANLSRAVSLSASLFVSVNFVISLLSLLFTFSCFAYPCPVYIFLMFLYAWNRPCVRVLVLIARLNTVSAAATHRLPHFTVRLSV